MRKGQRDRKNCLARIPCWSETVSPGKLPNGLTLLETAGASSFLTCSDLVHDGAVPLGMRDCEVAVSDSALPGGWDKELVAIRL